MSEQDLLSEADAKYRAGRYPEAIRLYEAARSARRDTAYQAYIDLNVAQCLRRQGHASEAGLLAHRGLQRFKSNQLVSVKAELLITLGNSEADLGRHLEALHTFESAYQEFTALNNRYGIYQSLICKSRSLLGVNETDEAEEVLESILEADDVPLLIQSQALTNLAALQLDKSPNRARQLLEQDLDLHGRLDDDYGLAGTLINLALIEIKLGDKDKAIVLLESARDAASRVNAADLLARALTMLHDLN